MISPLQVLRSRGELLYRFPFVKILLTTLFMVVPELAHSSPFGWRGNGERGLRPFVRHKVVMPRTQP
jgi:hypothetical protein